MPYFYGDSIKELIDEAISEHFSESGELEFIGSVTEFIRSQIELPSEVDMEDIFRDFLNEVYDEIHVLGCTFGAGDVLLELSPGTFNCEFSNWIDTEDVVEFNARYYRQNCFEKALEEYFSTLNLDELDPNFFEYTKDEE